MKEYLTLAIEAALAAGSEILKIYNSDFEVETKQDNSPLTIADKNANDIIISFLKRSGIPIISEENKAIDYSERKHWNQCWIVDPLDGTKEFIKRNGEFTVNIALVQNNVPLLGVIYVPVSKTLYFTSADAKGSRKTIIDSENISIKDIFSKAEKISPEHSSDIIKIVGSRSHLNEETKIFIADLEKNNNVEIITKGSSLKFCLVAEGLAQVYPRYAPTMEWDTAAGDAICRAVGLEVIDQSTQQPMEYNKEKLLNNYFLVQS